MSQDRTRRLATALVQHANNLSNMQDELSREQACEALGEAAALLDSLYDEGALRAWHCFLSIKLACPSTAPEQVLETIERGLRAAASEPARTGMVVVGLQALRANQLNRIGRDEEAARIAREARELQAGELARAVQSTGSGDELEAANNYLNLAVLHLNLGDQERGSQDLYEALRRLLQFGLFSNELVRVLQLASAIFVRSDILLGNELIIASAAALDVRRAMLRSDQMRIDFDESPDRRDIYEEALNQLLSYEPGLVQLGGSKDNSIFERYAAVHQEASRRAVATVAVVAADRSRARALAELLGPPEWGSSSVSVQTSPHADPPLRPYSDVREAFRAGATYIVREADEVLRQLGAYPRLDTDGIRALAADVGAPMLLIQPVRRRVALLLVRASGEVEVAFSPLTLEQLLELVGAVQDKLHIFAVPRGESGDPAISPQRRNLDEVLKKLWQALIAPLHRFLPVGEPLIIVPYREFTLLPFALLLDPQEQPLIQHHALSVVPSLATLQVLRKRGPWLRTHPVRAYVAGDPAVAPRHWLSRLPHARAEAEVVVEALETAGVGKERIAARFDEDAHEESYRNEARGCDLVHLSCHARLDEPAYTSCLFLAPYGSRDGLLLASEVVDVRLEDALVFLAACETGQGRATADGVIGLGRAFLEAGARAVILSLFKVEDAATAALSGHFYRALLASRMSCTAADALRTAMLATRADLDAGKIRVDNKPLASHPAHWAPFVVLGDALSIRYR